MKIDGIYYLNNQHIIYTDLKKYLNRILNDFLSFKLPMSNKNTEFQYKDITDFYFEWYYRQAYINKSTICWDNTLNIRSSFNIYNMNNSSAFTFINLYSSIKPNKYILSVECNIPEVNISPYYNCHNDLYCYTKVITMNKLEVRKYIKYILKNINY